MGSGVQRVTIFLVLHLGILDPVAANSAPQLPHERLEVTEGLQHGLMHEEAHVLDVVVSLILAGGLLRGVPGVNTLQNAQAAEVL